MFVVHVLDSSMYAMKIKIYLEYWRQDLRFEEKNMIWSRRRNEDGVLVWNSILPCSSLCVKQWMIKILRVWFQEKNSRYGSKRCHYGLMSWAMVDQDLEHAIKWRVLYVPQDIMVEHVKIQGWPRQRAEIGFKLVITWSIKNVPHGIMWSCGMVSLVNYALWTNPLSMCLCVVYVG